MEKPVKPATEATELSQKLTDAGIKSSELTTTGDDIPEMGNWKDREKAPEVKAPEVKKPEVKKPEVKAPEVELEDFDDIEDPTLREQKPKAVEEKEEVTEDASEEKLPEGNLGEKERDVRAAFTKLRTSLKTKIRDLETQLKAKGEGAGPTEEFKSRLSSVEKERDELRTRVQEQEKFVQVASVEQSEEFRQRVTTPKNQMKQDILRIAKDNGGTQNGVSATDIWGAIVHGDKKELNRIVPLLTETDRVELVSLARDYKGISTVEEAMRDNAGETLKAFEEQKVQQQQHVAVQSKKLFRDAVVSDVASIKESNPNLFKKYEGADEWNAEVDRVETWLEQMQNADPLKTRWLDHFGGFISKAAAFELANNRVRRLESELAKLRVKLVSKRAATPSAGTGSTVAPKVRGAGPQDVPDIGNFLNRRR